MVSTSVAGSPGTESYRLFFQEGGNNISPWHDIPLKSGEFFNAVIEIPKYTKAKMEIATKESGNPIAQDIKKGKLRDYHGPIFWNYGAFPQTWENPNVEHPVVKCKGDNDPVDVVEIGSKTLASGSINKVKVLGVLAMIDDGELDWKVIAIHADDPMAAKLNDIGDVETLMPGVVSGIREWFRWYKTPDDKPLNAFGFDEKALPKKAALEVQLNKFCLFHCNFAFILCVFFFAQVLQETHEYWVALKAGKTDKGKLWLA
jgi:inorganic pyrophosphatase